ncbi:hypothetical protein ACJJTC_002890 [Scirpophaga incertulas]
MTLAAGSWREEYVVAGAGWARAAPALRPLPGAALLHAALAPPAPREPLRLALTTDRADLLIWELEAGGAWRESWRCSLAPRDWAAAARARWAGPRRLLLAGALATARRWELLALAHVRTDSDESWVVTSRAGTAAGGAGCWADAGGDAYLTLQLHRLSPAHCATAVWLNASTQETESEYAGVTTELFKIYNENQASISHIEVAQVPLLADEETSGKDDCVKNKNPEIESAFVQMLVAGFSGMRGAVRTWALPALRPAPLLAAADGDLRTRRALHARRRAAAAAVAAAAGDGDPGLLAEAELDEATARALCAPPEYQYLFEDALVGLTVAPEYFYYNNTQKDISRIYLNS